MWALEPPDATFCSSCGAPLQYACPDCGRINPAEGTFCIGCGTRRTARDSPVRPAPGCGGQRRGPRDAPPSPGPRGGERRYLTVMFCDLVDSTRLAGELDPEDMRDLVMAYQRVCTDAIAEYSGFVAQYLGDGVLAYFGYPDAHEDDARLAVAAGTAIAGAVAELAVRFGRPDIDARVGSHRSSWSDPHRAGRAARSSRAHRALAPAGRRRG